MQPVLAVLFAMLALLPGQGGQGAATPPAQVSPSLADTKPVLPDKVPTQEALGAKELAADLGKGATPLILAVGPRTLFDQAHILNATYAGPAGTEAGGKVLDEAVASVAKDRWIVVYCGCCPWDKCPNVRPALERLRGRGFVHVQMLYLPAGFQADWTAMGYPVEK